VRNGEAGDAASDKVHRIADGYFEKYPWADRDAIELCFRVESAAAALVSTNHQLHKALGLDSSTGRGAVLRVLYFSTERRMSQIEIGTQTRVTPANVTYQVDALEKEGLVSRGPHPSDRRITLVELTKAGEAVCEKLFPARTLLLTKAGELFAQEEKELFIELLERFERNLDHCVDLASLDSESRL
jgi:DNA-binding MarR family transcriptional regulator